VADQHDSGTAWHVAVVGDVDQEFIGDGVLLDPPVEDKNGIAKIGGGIGAGVHLDSEVVHLL
jgi:hypothetical protein